MHRSVSYTPAMFDQFLGLPLHPLVVHAVVVLLPLGALGLLVLAAWSKGRRVGLPLVTAVLAVATGSAWVARFSGQALRQHVGVPDPHATLGGLLPLVATLTFVLAVVWWLRHRSGKDALWLRLLAAVVAVVAVVMTALVGTAARSRRGARSSALLRCRTSPRRFPHLPNLRRQTARTRPQRLGGIRPPTWLSTRAPTTAG